MTIPKNKQDAAIVLAAGGSHAEAAKAAGVERQTVYGWTSKNQEFLGELDRLRRASFEEAEGVLRSMAVTAALVVREAIQDGDVKVALTVLRGLGILVNAEKREVDTRVQFAGDLSKPITPETHTIAEAHAVIDHFSKSN